MTDEPTNAHDPRCPVWTQPGPVDHPEADCTCRTPDGHSPTWVDQWRADWHHQVDVLTARFTRGHQPERTAR